ncbi:hypothetical protein D3C71_661590 [compost metagenome]
MAPVAVIENVVFPPEQIVLFGGFPVITGLLPINWHPEYAVVPAEAKSDQFPIVITAERTEAAVVVGVPVQLNFPD